MNIKEAAQAFINCHKPTKIDVDYICQNYGSVEFFIELHGDFIESNEMYLEVRGLDTLSGNPVIIEWEVD